MLAEKKDQVSELELLNFRIAGFLERTTNNLRYMELYDCMCEIVYVSNKFHLISTQISKTLPAILYSLDLSNMLAEKISSLETWTHKIGKKQRNYFRALSISWKEGAHEVLLRRLDNEI